VWQEVVMDIIYFSVSHSGDPYKKHAMQQYPLMMKVHEICSNIQQPEN
jgi:hypothetical protein